MKERPCSDKHTPQLWKANFRSNGPQKMVNKNGKKQAKMGAIIPAADASVCGQLKCITHWPDGIYVNPLGSLVPIQLHLGSYQCPWYVLSVKYGMSYQLLKADALISAMRDHKKWSSKTCGLLSEVYMYTHSSNVQLLQRSLWKGPYCTHNAGVRQNGKCSQDTMIRSDQETMGSKEFIT